MPKSKELELSPIPKITDSLNVYDWNAIHRKLLQDGVVIALFFGVGAHLTQNVRFYGSEGYFNLIIITTTSLGYERVMINGGYSCKQHKKSTSEGNTWISPGI